MNETISANAIPAVATPQRRLHLWFQPCNFGSYLAIIVACFNTSCVQIMLWYANHLTCYGLPPPIFCCFQFSHLWFQQTNTLWFR